MGWRVRKKGEKRESFFFSLQISRRKKKEKNLRKKSSSLSAHTHPVRDRLDQVRHQRRRAVDELGELVDLCEVARVEEVGHPVGGLGA